MAKKTESPVDTKTPEDLNADTTTTATPTATQAEKADVKKSTESTAEGNGGFCVYLGPSIHGVILRGTVFGGDKKSTLAELDSAIKAQPLIAALIVPGDALSESLIKVKAPGNLLYENYRKLAGRITTK